MERAFFNLWFNASLSFLGATAIVAIALLPFRPMNPAWQVYLCTLPFVKLVADLVRGIPTKSWLNSGLDLYALPKGTRWLSITAGNGDFGPYAALSFSINDGQGGKLALSVPDWALAWIETRLAPETVTLIVAFVLLVSCLLLGRELASWWFFERARRADLASGTTVQLGTRKLGRRNVTIYVSATQQGSPFTGGVLKPWICMPRATYESLSTEERDAVLAHEMGHVRTFDVLQTIVIRALAAVFWLVPGYRWVTRKLDATRELLADHAAVRSGADPVALADVLLRLQEMKHGVQTNAACSALVKPKSLVERRVRRLVEKRVGASGWALAGSVAFAGFVSLVVLLSNFGGNGLYH